MNLQNNLPVFRRAGYFIPLWAVLILSFLAPMPAASQISLSPTIFFIHEEEPRARLTVRNTGGTDQEIDITPRFGYPESDDEGSLNMNYDDEEMEAARGLNEYLRVFPRRFVLEPGEFQRVRIQVRPPEARPDGLYWTRLNITSSEVAPDIDSPVAEEGIGTRISYRIRQNLGVFFHKGQVRTALNLDDLQLQREDEELLMAMQLSSGGNSPYMGSMSARLLDSAGNAVAEGEWLFSVFGQRYWPHRMEIGDLAPGRYRLDLEFTTRRSDVASDDLPEAETVTESQFIQL